MLIADPKIISMHTKKRPANKTETETFKGFSNHNILSPF